MKKIIVVIPFNAEGAQGRELEYAVAGWRRHFKESHEIVVVGEALPEEGDWSGVTFIKSERIPAREGQYRQHLDYVRCLKRVREAYPKSRGFVFVADDCYAVNDFDLSDILYLKAMPREIGDEQKSPNLWKRDAAKTRARLLADGYPVRDYTTHLPQWYEWERLAALWERYDMENESFVFEDLYYNIYYPTRLPLLIRDEYDSVKCALYFPNISAEGIRAAMRRKIWVTNSPNGWTKALDQVLNDYYFGER